MRQLTLKCDNCRALFTRMAIPPHEVNRVCDYCGREMRLVDVHVETVRRFAIVQTRYPPGAREA